MADFDGFGNRLRKNLRRWRKWARRRDVTCFRAYDREMPDFPVVVDVYEGRPHLQEYATSWEGSEEEQAAWAAETTKVVADVFGLGPEELPFKTRRRQKGLDQYEKTGMRGREIVVHEGGLEFLVNLEAYLDTGLFLDHRITRSMVRELAANKRVLNLFSYTGSFTVYAGDGGASRSLSVDLSNTYLDWCRRNLELNGLDPEAHEVIRADVLTFVDEARVAGDRFDLVVLDPPSFSNSKKMQETFDVQRDHPHIVNACLELLAPGGELLFSTNRRGFALAEEKLSSCALRDLTRQTTPEDFARSKPHMCWLMRRG